MSDTLPADTVRHALANIIERAPAPAPRPLRRAARAGGSTRRRLVPVAAAAVGAAGVGAVAVIDGRESQAPGTAGTATIDTVAAEPRAVVGDPACGEELPIRAIVARSGGMRPGPVAGAPSPAEGQLVVHWELAGGYIEARWPADERALYGLGRSLGPQEGMDWSSASPQDGGVLEVSFPLLDPVADGSLASNPRPANLPPTLALHVSDAPGLDAPCDVLQVRYIAAEGGVATLGYALRPVDAAAATRWEQDLNPLIVTTQTGSGPTPDEVVGCNGVHGGEVEGSPVAAAPAEALAALLANEQTLIQSGYDEFVSADGDRYTYAIRNESGIVTLITVEPAGDGWAVTSRYHPGC